MKDRKVIKIDEGNCGQGEQNRREDDCELG